MILNLLAQTILLIFIIMIFSIISNILSKDKYESRYNMIFLLCVAILYLLLFK